MGMSKMATGNIKIFISRLNDFEIAQSADEKLMRRKKKKLAKTREAILSPESSSFSVSGAMPGISRYFIYDYYSVLSKPSDSSNPSRPRHSSNTIGKKGTSKLTINICRYTIIIIIYEVLTQRLLETGQLGLILIGLILILMIIIIQ